MKVKLPVTEGLITRNHYKLRPIFSHSSVSGRGVTPSGLRKKHEKERKKESRIHCWKTRDKTTVRRSLFKTGRAITKLLEKNKTKQ